MIASTPLSLLLLNLPDEVLITIFGFLDIRTLYNATLVCKHFCDLSEPFLYHTIQILNGRQATALSASFQTSPFRTTWVRSLLISTKFGDDQGLCTLPPYISRMRNLQTLCLETPDCNAKFPEERVSWVSLQDRYERIFESASAVVPESFGRVLPNLKQCESLVVGRRLPFPPLIVSSHRHSPLRRRTEGNLFNDQICHAFLTPQSQVSHHVLCEYRFCRQAVDALPK